MVSSSESDVVVFRAPPTPASGGERSRSAWVRASTTPAARTAPPITSTGASWVIAPILVHRTGRTHARSRRAPTAASVHGRDDLAGRRRVLGAGMTIRDQGWSPRGTDRRGRATARGAGSSWSPRHSRCVGATPMLNTATADTAPATFVVTSLDDVNDGTCNTAHCSLREAMTAAGATTDADRIEFAVTGTITPTTMLPTIFRPVEIDGGRRAGLHRSADDRPRREHDDELGGPRREQGCDGSRPRVLELADGHLAVVGKRAAVQLRRHRRDGYGRRAEPDRRFDRRLREHRRRDRSALRQHHLRQ